MAIHIMAAFEQPPPILDFIWPGFLAGSVGALVAPGATGKSWWALEAAMAVACGVKDGDILGLAPAASGRVVYLAAEDPEPALVCRLHTLGAHLGQAAREAIAERLLLEPILGKRLNIMDESHLSRVIEVCTDVRLLVLDTLSRIHTLDENDNGEMAKVVSQLEYIAAQTGAAVLFLHHVSKASARERGDEQQAARGASALVDNARWAGYLTQMSESDGKYWSDRIDRAPIGVRRGLFVRWGVSKQNYGSGFAPQWFRRDTGGVLVPVDLLEAVDDTKRSRGGGDRAHA